MSKQISKNTKIHQKRKSKKILKENNINPHLQMGHYIWGLVGTAIANHFNNSLKNDQDMET